MICYCIKNNINNKRYIGITIQKIEYRMRCHEKRINEGFSSAFYNAVRKYGKGNFIFDFIKDYTGLITQSELKEIEVDMISKYNTYYNGYNMTLGGDGGLGVPIKQYDLNGKYLNTFESLTIAEQKTGINYTSISQCISGKLLTSGGFLWTAIGKRPINYINPQEKIVIQRDKQGNLIQKFKSISEASNSTKINLSSISENCLNKRLSAGGFVWHFENINPQKYINPKLRPVLKCDNNWNTLEKFNSITEAAKLTNILRPNINKCCIGDRNFAGGFKWKYAELELTV